jgi:Ca-activated chloride channel family protein
MRMRSVVVSVGLVAVVSAGAALFVPSLMRARVATPVNAPALATRPRPDATYPKPAPPAATAVAPTPASRPHATDAAAAQAPRTREDRGRRSPEAATLLGLADEKVARLQAAPAQFAGGLAKNGLGLERYVGPMNTEAYDRIRDNAFLAVASNPLSTFSIDVDTASYANVRRFLESGQLPPKDAVRIEELINYFRYDYAQPETTQPFSVTTELSACPWAGEHRLALIGLQGRTIADEQLPPRNLVFLLDVSGSMNAPRKLPLLKAAMGLLIGQLRPEDRVAIVVYAGASGLVLPPTAGSQQETIRAALDGLYAGGSTAGGAGIQLAYDVAGDSFIPEGINRVILATDGDFNVGITNQGDLVRLIEEKRESGVFLSVLGFGEGNLKDSTMEKLADSGNGNYAYIDSLSEARKVLVQQAGATLVTIAKDVKIQVEFNPARVAAYRLIGYENRVLAAEDFNDDTKDAGEIGAGHSVTALYEIVPAGVAVTLPSVDPLKYQAPRGAAAEAKSDELLTVKLRYKQPDGDVSRLLSVALKDGRTDRLSSNARFAAAVAGFGMLLRDSEHKGSLTWAQVLELAGGATQNDPFGYRSQFRELVRTAEALSGARQVSAIR